MASSMSLAASGTTKRVYDVKQAARTSDAAALRKVSAVRRPGQTDVSSPFLPASAVEETAVAMDADATSGPLPTPTVTKLPPKRVRRKRRTSPRHERATLTAETWKAEISSSPTATSSPLLPVDAVEEVSAVATRTVASSSSITCEASPAEAGAGDEWPCLSRAYPTTGKVGKVDTLDELLRCYGLLLGRTIKRSEVQTELLRAAGGYQAVVHLRGAEPVVSYAGHHFPTGPRSAARALCSAIEVTIDGLCGGDVICVNGTRQAWQSEMV